LLQTADTESTYIIQLFLEMNQSPIAPTLYAK